MHLTRHHYTVFALTLLTLPHAAMAENHILGSIGMFDIRHQERSTQFGLEWHGDSFYKNFLPIAGGTLDMDGDSYGFGGVQYEYALNNTWTITPSFAIGLYHDGAGKDMGGPLEFRSSLGIDYRLDNASRLGLAMNHISNAGLYDRNPGAESVVITWSLPLETFFSAKH